MRKSAFNIAAGEDPASLRHAIIHQAAKQGFKAEAVRQGATFRVTLEGTDAQVIAYEAAIRSGVSKS